MSDRRLSLIVTLYQQQEFLPHILTALDQQDFNGDWDVVVCDDGSSDEAFGLVRSSKLAADRDVRYIWQPDLGFRAGRARNNGIRCTSGDVIVFLDGDCVPDKQFLSRHAEAHNGTARVVCGSRSYIFLAKHSLNSISQVVLREGLTGLSHLAHMPTRSFQESRISGISPWSALCGCNFSASRATAVQFDEAFVGWGMEDYELALRLWAEHGFELTCDVDNTVYHLEKTPPAVFHPLRPRDPEAIALYVQNVLRLSERHPSANLACLWDTLCAFALDEEKTWHMIETGKPIQGATRMFDLAREWSQLTKNPAVMSLKDV